MKKSKNVLDFTTTLNTVKDMYEVKQDSLENVAKHLNMSVSTLRRFAIKNGIKIRDRSEAQKLALANNRSKHPTEGKKRDEKAKEKISQGKAKAWAELPEEDKQAFSQQARDRWEQMTEDEKNNLSHAAARAIRETVKTGSKLENYIRLELTKHNFRVVFHTDHMLVNQKLQIDLLLPEINTAIEVDGPSHVLPIWGHEALEKTKKADDVKNGLLLANGFAVIRVRQTQKHVSKAYMQSVADKVVKKVLEIQNQFPPKHLRLIEI